MLLLLYAEAGDAEAAEALALDPARACDGAAAAPRLLQLGRFVAAAAALERSGDAAAALRTLREVAEGKLAETAAPAANAGRGGQAGPSGAGQAGQPRGSCSASSAAARLPPAEAAVDLAARVLARCGDAGVFLLYADWLCDAHPQALLRALTQYRKEAAKGGENTAGGAKSPGTASAAAQAPPPLPAPQEEVLALLRRKGGAILVPFLEHLVASEGTQDAGVHTELALALMGAARDAQQAAASAAAAAGEVGARLAEAGARLRKFLDESDQYNVAAVSARVQAEERASALQAGGAAAAAAAWLPALVVLAGKVNDHPAALRILLEKLGDIDAAEQYCAERRTPGARSDAYLAMLRLLLGPAPPAPPAGAPQPPQRLQGVEARRREAARLLLKASWAVDPIEAIRLLPDDMPLQEVVAPLGGVLKRAVHAHREAQVQRGLHRTRHQRAAEAVVAERSRAVVVTPERCCSSCHVRLARADGRDFRPIVRFPSGLIACYKCTQQLTGAMMQQAAGLQLLEDRLI